MHKKWIVLSFILLFCSACTRSFAGPTPVTTITPTLSFAKPVAQSTQSTQTEITKGYAVIRVPENEALNIRSGPGLEHAIIGVLQPNQTSLVSTGPTASDGVSMWIEIENPDGGTGWVNADYLTEYVPPSSFCADVRVKPLLIELENAVKTKDAEALMKLVSPLHGLDVTFIRGGMVANYSIEEASWVFQSTYVVDWGIAAGSGELVSGTFPDVVLPAIQDVFKNMQTTCNELVLGGATYVADWPMEYSNINFYSLYNPGNDPTYEGLDWRTWLVGVEYVGGEPYLFSLIHYQWEP